MFRSALLLGAVWSAAGWAQACCAGTSLLSPARLTPHEDALVALETRSAVQGGSLDPNGTFRANAPQSGGVDFTQTCIGVLRVLKEGQVTLLVPVVESGRWAQGLSDWGAGVGDVSVAFRYDFLLAGESARWPGFSVLAAFTFPTGKSPERASHLLGADATGAGVWQGQVGLGLEQTWGRLFVQGNALAQQGLPRLVNGLTSTLGTAFSLGGAGGVTFDGGGAVAVTASALAALPAWLDGVQVPRSARWRASVGLSGAVPISEAWRLQGTLISQLPVGANELFSVTVSLLLMRTWS